MSTVINTNIDALTAQRNLSSLSLQYSKSVEKLSSGLRINRAADDAAGLAISQNLEAQVNGLNQAQRNAQDGISMIQTAEGALNEVQAMLQRMRELAVEASNGTLGSSDLQSVGDEMAALASEINRDTSTTQFNGIQLLDGTAGTSGNVTLQIGANGSDTLTVTFGKQDVNSLFGTNSSLLSSIMSSSADGSFTAISSASNSDYNSLISGIDTAIQAVSTARGEFGASQNRLEHTINSLGVASENLSASQSRIQDLDVASEMVNFTKLQILQQAGTAILAQANQAPQTVLKLLQ